MSKSPPQVIWVRDFWSETSSTYESGGGCTKLTSEVTASVRRLYTLSKAMTTLTRVAFSLLLLHTKKARKTKEGTYLQQLGPTPSHPPIARQVLVEAPDNV